MKSEKVKHTFLKVGRLLKVYTDDKYVYSLGIDDAIKVANSIRDAVRATGPVSVACLEIQQEEEART